MNLQDAKQKHVLDLLSSIPKALKITDRTVTEPNKAIAN